MTEPFDFPRELRCDGVMLDKTHPYTADMLRRAAIEIEQLRDFVGWIDTWISNPARAYSHDALEGLFGMTRDKINALSKTQLDEP